MILTLGAGGLLRQVNAGGSAGEWESSAGGGTGDENIGAGGGAGDENISAGRRRR